MSRCLLSLLLCALALPHALGAHDPIAAVDGLLVRLLGAPARALFQLETVAADPATGLDVFELGSNGSLVVLRGNCGSSLAAALNVYLKYELNASVTWGRNASGVQVRLPPVLPLPAPTRTVMPAQRRYAW